MTDKRIHGTKQKLKVILKANFSMS